MEYRKTERRKPPSNDEIITLIWAYAHASEMGDIESRIKILDEIRNLFEKGDN